MKSWQARSKSIVDSSWSVRFGRTLDACGGRVQHPENRSWVLSWAAILYPVSTFQPRRP